MLHAKTPVHHRSTITTPGQLHVRSISRTFHGPACSSTAQRGIGLSVAEILDPANFKKSYGSSEKDADRESAAAVVAVAGHLESSLSAPVIYLEISRKVQAVVSNCKHTSFFLR